MPTPLLKYLHLLKINERMKYKVRSLSKIYLSKRVQLPDLRSFLLFPSRCSTRSSFLITISRPLPSRFEIASRSFYHSAPVLGNSLSSDQRHVAHHVIPNSLTNSPVSYLSTSFLLKKVKKYLQYRTSFVVSSRTHFAIIHPHFIHANFYFVQLLYAL